MAIVLRFFVYRSFKTVGLASLVLGVLFSFSLGNLARAQSEARSTEVELETVLLRPWVGPYGGVPPWNEVRPEEFVSAIEGAIAEHIRELKAIAESHEKPTFANTIEALERSGKTLQRVTAIFDVYTSNLNLGPIADIERRVVPMLAAHEDSITQNEQLFGRISELYEAAELTEYSSAQKRLLEDRYKSFVRRGAKLSAEEKTKLAQINSRLASLFTDFSQNVLADEQGYVTWVEREEDLAGLPKSVVDAMAAAASARGRNEVWAVTNTRSSMDPFLTYAKNRGLREQVWRTYYNRGDNGDEHDNNAIITEILRLRAIRAKMLGYATHAHWRLEPQMAKTPDAAMDLMMRVWPKAVARVAEEVADMQKIADEEGVQITIEPWDYRYYAEKVRKAKYDLDLNEVKPYLQLEKLREGMMWAAGELFGFQFKQINNVPVFHPDVRVWEVVDRDGKHVGLWYLDPYAREGKRSGAWMTDYRPQEKLSGEITTIVSNNSNFIKGVEGQPVLISWDDAVTLFHEFGHALHGLCSNVVYPSQSGTNVARDYVEFPSQINEHWLPTPEVLSRFAIHYETGEAIPQELVDKIERASTFNQGFATVEYLASALVDMKLHLAGDVAIDPDLFERETLEQLGMPNEIVMRHRTPHFSHIFSSDGYSAGYYSYLWSDALTADAAEVFESNGGYYAPEIAKRFYQRIMSVGDTVDPVEAFRAFRGRDVDTGALLRKRGFPVQ